MSCLGMPLEKEMFEVDLECQPVTGCGITIVGSRSSGIAIQSLLPGGVAHLVSIFILVEITYYLLFLFVVARILFYKFVWLLLV